MDSRDGDALSRLGATRPATTQDTTLAAQAAIQHARPGLQRTIYEYIFNCGTAGATDEEIQISTGMNGSTERPRRKELENAGVIISSGQTRRTASGRSAIIWTVRQQDVEQHNPDTRDEPNRRTARRNPARFSW